MPTCQREWGRQQQNRQTRCNGLVLLQYTQACDKWWISTRRLSYLAQHILMRFCRLCPVLSFSRSPHWNSSCQYIWESFRVSQTNWQSYEWKEDGISHFTCDRNGVLLVLLLLLLCDTESFVRFSQSQVSIMCCALCQPIQCKKFKWAPRKSRRFVSSTWLALQLIFHFAFLLRRLLERSRHMFIRLYKI